MFGRRSEFFEEPQPVSTTMGQTLLRVVVGVVLAAHGWQKMMDFGAWQEQVASLGIPFPEIAAPLALAAELLGGLGLIFGLLTRLAAFGVFCNMAVAIATVHLHKGLFAENGGFEFPLVLAAAAVFFIAAGPGPISLEAFMRKRARHRAIQQDETWSRPPYQPLPEEGVYDDDPRYAARQHPSRQRTFPRGPSSSRH
jgi:putative oxidoreductase